MLCFQRRKKKTGQESGWKGTSNTFSVYFPTPNNYTGTSGEDAVYRNCLLTVCFSHQTVNFLKAGTTSTFLITASPVPSSVPGTQQTLSKCAQSMTIQGMS